MINTTKKMNNTKKERMKIERKKNKQSSTLRQSMDYTQQKSKKQIEPSSAVRSRLVKMQGSIQINSSKSNKNKSHNTTSKSKNLSPTYKAKRDSRNSTKIKKKSGIVTVNFRNYLSRIYPEDI